MSAAAGALAAFLPPASLSLLRRSRERALRPAVALGATAMAFFLMAGHLTARPHAVALPVLVAWAAALVRARDRSRIPSLWLLPLMVLWANLHGGFVVGLGLAGVLAVEAVLTACPGPARRAAIWGWGRFLAGAALASLLTPQGIAGWWVPFKLMSLGFALDFVGEWHAPLLGPFEPLVLWLAVLLVFALGNGLRAPLSPGLMVAGPVARAPRPPPKAQRRPVSAP